MKRLFKIFLIGVILFGQLNVVEARRGKIIKIKPKPPAPTAAPTAAPAVAASTINGALKAETDKLMTVELDPTYRKIVKRAMTQIDKITSSNFSGVKTQLDDFVNVAVDAGTLDEGIGNDANRIIVKTAKTDQKTLTDLAIKLYAKKSAIGEVAAKKYVTDIYTEILEEQRAKIPGKGSTKSFKKFIKRMAPILKTIPGYYTELAPDVQDFIDYANIKGQKAVLKSTRKTNKTAIENLLATLNPKFQNKLEATSPGAEVLKKIETLNKADDDPKYRKALHPFVTETLAKITSESKFNTQKNQIRQFVAIAISEGAGDTITPNKNKVFRKKAGSGQKTLTDLAIALASKPYTKELGATVVYMILEQQIGNIPGRIVTIPGITDKFVTFINNLKTHVLLSNKKLIKKFSNDAEVSEKLQQFVSTAKEKVYGQTDRKDALGSFVEALQKNGYPTLVY
jgi:hypothetical protein